MNNFIFLELSEKEKGDNKKLKIAIKMWRI